MPQMIYRTMPQAQEKLSILGYGCMRFPRRGPTIDLARTEKQILSALDQGVNYLDTAYLYPGSEAMLGKILHKHQRRDDVYIATKLPVFLIKDQAGFERSLNTQLEHLQTDYVDYYLMHNLASFEDWQRLKDLGALDFLQREQERGRLRHIGFSFHGNLHTFKRLVDDYPWDFCQIQYNYLDENFQAGREGLHYAAGKGLGVVVMEPLRGGLLGAKMPPAAQHLFDANPEITSPAETALRWLWQQPEIQVVLSGMNEEAHIAENIRIAAGMGDKPKLSENEEVTLQQAKQFFQEKIKVPCTACAYCMPCPHGVDIPTCFAWYNTHSMSSGSTAKWHYALATEGAINGKPSKASACKNCGLCEQHCPQQIEIRQQLQATAATMEKGVARPLLKLAAKFLHRGQPAATDND